MAEAATVLFIFLLIALALVLSLNRLSILLSLVALLLTGVSPFTKRIVNTPQLFLGTAFGWGAVIAWAAVRNEVALPSLLIFLATVFWATGYDTIYALMDIDDDIRIGVKSTAILFGRYTWFVLAILFLITIFILFAVGRMSRLCLFFILLLVLLTIGFFYLGY